MKVFFVSSCSVQVVLNGRMISSHIDLNAPESNQIEIVSRQTFYIGKYRIVSVQWIVISYHDETGDVHPYERHSISFIST